MTLRPPPIPPHLSGAYAKDTAEAAEIAFLGLSDRALSAELVRLSKGYEGTSDWTATALREAAYRIGDV